jgi:hypothetical protein
MDAIEMLKKYKNSSTEINEQLRSGVINSETCVLDELFVENEVPPTLYRLLDNNIIEFDGDIYCDSANLSCTDDIDNFILKTDPTDHLACFRINMPSSFPCIHVEDLLPEYNGEGEYILPRNLKLKLVDTPQEYNTLLQFDEFLDERNSVTGSKELWAHGIRKITLYTLEIV